jgi:hypothetical protein
VKSGREALFSKCLAEHASLADAVTAFHCRRVEDRDAWAPMMYRSASLTKSVTQVVITPSRATMLYCRRETAIANGLAHPDKRVSVELNS